jgi:hypothetical protein
VDDQWKKRFSYEDEAVEKLLSIHGKLINLRSRKGDESK